MNKDKKRRKKDWSETGLSVLISGPPTSKVIKVEGPAQSSKRSEELPLYASHSSKYSLFTRPATSINVSFSYYQGSLKYIQTFFRLTSVGLTLSFLNNGLVRDYLQMTLAYL